MSAESLAAFHAFLAEQERKRQRPSLARSLRQTASAAPRPRFAAPSWGRGGTAVTRDRSLVRRSAVVVGALTVGVGLGGGAAVAYWSTSAAGTGSAATAATAAVTVTPGTVSGTPLYPGLTANGTSAGGDLVVFVTNPNPFAVSVVLSSRGAVTATGCTTSDVTFSGGTLTVPANTTQPVTRKLPFSVGMGTASTSDCQGKTLTVPVQAAITSTTS